jgi:predicted transcriptional regulator
MLLQSLQLRTLGKTQRLRRNLRDQRDMDIEKMSAEGKTQDNIAACTGASQMTVSRIIAQSKTQTAQMVEDEGEQETQTAQTVQSEEPTSVFTHATSETLMSLS